MLVRRIKQLVYRSTKVYECDAQDDLCGSATTTKADLLDWFDYPEEFLTIVEQGLIDFTPWRIITGNELHEYYKRLNAHYPNKGYVSFAKSDACDDFACWLKDSNKSVLIIHDSASKGWENEEKACHSANGCAWR